MGKKQHCKNHPMVYAEMRCVKCNTPLCRDCCVVEEGKTFCNLDCYNDFADFRRRKDKISGKKDLKIDYGKWAKRLLSLAIIGAIAYYLLVVEGVRSFQDLVDLLNAFIDWYKGE